MTSIFSSILKSNIKVFLVLALLVVSAYSFMLHSPFKNLDDEFSIIRNVEIRDLSNIPHFFTSTYFKVDKDYYRPMVYVTYALEYHAFGLNYFNYNLDNVLIHALNAFLLFLVGGYLFNDRIHAFWVSVLFAVHPIHWEAVGNVSGRAILLCALFVLSAFYFLLRYMRDERPRDLALMTLCYALALLSKESAGMFIAVAAVYWVTAGRKSPGSLVRLWPLPLVVVAYLVQHHLMHITVPFPWPSFYWMSLGVTTFLRGVFTYLRLMILPVNLYFDRARLIYESFRDPGAWIVLGTYSTLLFLFVRNFGRLPKLVLFCVVWFWFELFPVSQVVSSIGTYPQAISLAEHFMYLASIPLCVLLVLGVDEVIRRKVLSVKAVGVAAGGFILFLYLMLVQQNIYAGNELLVLQNSLKNDPRNARIEYALANIYVRTHKLDQALEHFRKAAERNPGNPNYQIALGNALANTGDHLAAVRIYEVVPPRKDIDELLAANKKSAYTALVRQYEERLKVTPRDPEVLFALGVFNGRLGKSAEAYASFASAWSVDQARFDALFNMGVMAEQMGETLKAEEAFSSLVRLAAPDNAFRKQVEARVRK